MLLGSKPGARAIGATQGGPGGGGGGGHIPTGYSFAPYVYYITGLKNCVVVDANGNTVSNTPVASLPSPAPMRPAGWSYVQCAVNLPARAIWTNGATANPNNELVVAYTKNAGVTWTTVQLNNPDVTNTINRATIDSFGTYAYIHVKVIGDFNGACATVKTRIDRINLDTGAYTPSWFGLENVSGKQAIKGGQSTSIADFGYMDIAADASNVFMASESYPWDPNVVPPGCDNPVIGILSWIMQALAADNDPANSGFTSGLAPVNIASDPVRWSSGVSNQLSHSIYHANGNIALFGGGGTTSNLQYGQAAFDWLHRSWAYVGLPKNGVTPFGWAFNQSGSILAASKLVADASINGIWLSGDRGANWNKISVNAGSTGKVMITTNPNDPENEFLSIQDYIGDGAADTIHIHRRRFDNPNVVIGNFAAIIPASTFQFTSGAICSGLVRLPGGTI